MGLNEFRDEARDFLVKIGQSEQDTSEIFPMLDREIALLKSSINNREKLRHKIYDVLFLLFELSGQYDCDLDLEWEKGRKKKQKKYLQ
jgi:hypothetical protein